MSSQVLPVAKPQAKTTQQSIDETLAEIQRLRAENERLRITATRSPALSVKVTDKGGLSVYGLGRFPVTLYREQWSKLFAAKELIEGMLPRLPFKADKVQEKGGTY